MNVYFRYIRGIGLGFYAVETSKRVVFCSAQQAELPPRRRSSICGSTGTTTWMSIHLPRVLNQLRATRCHLERNGQGHPDFHAFRSITKDEEDWPTITPCSNSRRYERSWPELDFDLTC